jgi:UDP-N-acetylglucosamine 1-carboxyvinyltransferase
MISLRIDGPARIHGSLRLKGNKNAVLPMLAAAMLTPEPVTLRNVPDILDVRNMLSIVQAMGANSNWQGETLTLSAQSLHPDCFPQELCQAIRTSILFAGPLVARFGEVTLGMPGGDVIGRRRLDTHFYGLRKLGVDIEATAQGYNFVRTAPRLHGCEMFLDEASVTATEHILMTACLAEGRTIIRNAACEPHVISLANLLTAMGAHITGQGTNLLVVDGVESLHGADCTVESDHVEAVSYLALAAATMGELEVTGLISPSNYWMPHRVFERFGCRLELAPNRLYLKQQARPVISPDLNNAIPVISDGPWPQFPSDMMSSFIALATQATGTVLFFEKMFESRMYFVDKLISMGASAVVCDPHRAVISGPATLHGVEMTSPDIRAGMAMVIAACCAQGRSVIRNLEMIKRGYTSLTENLLSLGVNCQEI